MIMESNQKPLKTSKDKSELSNLTGFLDVLIQIDLAQKAKAKQIDNTTK